MKPCATGAEARIHPPLGRTRHGVHARVILAAALTAGLLTGCASGPPRAPHDGYCVTGYGCYRVLASAAGYRADGIASWYGLRSVGRPTASGVPFNPNALRVASKTLPFGTWVRIRNRRTGLVAIAMVDDRGPFYAGRILDATPAVARELGYYLSGTAPVRVTAIPPDELNAAERAAARTDERIALAYARHHRHELLAEAGRFALHGVVDITSTGVRIAVGIVWDSLKLAVDLIEHL